VRILIAAVAALLAVGAASPVLALAPPIAVPGPSSVVRRLPDGGAAGPAVVRKKKKEAVTIRNVTGAKKGKNGLRIRVKVAKADRTCELELEWNDGSSPEIEDADAGTNKYCTFTVDVPDDDEVVGEATMTVTVKSATGKKLNEVEGSFTVKK
jgi:hypothetical protein